MAIAFPTKQRGPDVVSAIEPSIKYHGKSWYDTVNDTLKFWNANTQQWVLSSSISAVVLPEGFTSGDKCVIGGGSATNNSWAVYNTIEYCTISTTSNSALFGNLVAYKGEPSSTSNGSSNRGLFVGGESSSGVGSNTIEYVNIAIVGNAASAGTLTQARWWTASTSNSINDRGVTIGGFTPTVTAAFDYYTISSGGSASSFGTISAKAEVGAVSNGIQNKALICGGWTGSSVIASIEIFSFKTLGTVAAFGSLTVGRAAPSAISNSMYNRAVFAGGYDGSVSRNVIDYVTISSGGNASNFGTLSQSAVGFGHTSNGVLNRGILAGGSNTSSPNAFNTINYLTISSLSNSMNFGNLVSARHASGACSNAL